MKEIYWVIIGMIALNLLAWGGAKSREEILLKLDKIEKQDKEILEMLDRRAGK